MEKVKIAFLSQEVREHDASGEEIKHLFEMAEKITDKDLMKLERVIKAMENQNDNSNS